MSVQWFLRLLWVWACIHQKLTMILRPDGHLAQNLKEQKQSKCAKPYSCPHWEGLFGEAVNLHKMLKALKKLQWVLTFSQQNPMTRQKASQNVASATLLLTAVSYLGGYWIFPSTGVKIKEVRLFSTPSRL